MQTADSPDQPSTRVAAIGRRWGPRLPPGPGGNRTLQAILRPLWTILLLCLFLPCLRAASPGEDPALLAAARAALPPAVPTDSIVTGIRSGLWNPARTALALAIPQPKASVLLVLMRQPTGAFLAADASRVEDGNLGKLGWSGRSGFDRVETTPVRWMRRDDGLFQVVMRTRAWRAGQRHTVSEPLVLRPDGTVLYR